MHKSAWIILAVLALGGLAFWANREGVFADWLGRRGLPADATVQASGLQEALVTHARSRVRLLQRLLEVAGSDCECAACLATAEAAWAAEQDELARQADDVRLQVARLGPREREAEVSRALAELQPDVQAMAGNELAAASIMQQFKARCPTEVGALNQRIVEIKLAMQTVLSPGLHPIPGRSTPVPGP
jgi:hypothetical protein